MLVLEPRTAGRTRPSCTSAARRRDTDEFFADARYGEFWVGARPTIEEIETELGLTARHIDELADARQGRRRRDGPGRAGRGPRADRRSTTPALRRQPRTLDGVRRRARPLPVAAAPGQGRVGDRAAAPAVAATHRGFEAVVRPGGRGRGGAASVGRGRFGLPGAARGQRRRLRLDRRGRRPRQDAALDPQHGDLREGDLLLLDAGVEDDSLFTADVTRTLPVDGRFTTPSARSTRRASRRRRPAFAAAAPGNKLSDIHAAAMRVIAERLQRAGPAARRRRRRGEPRQGARPTGAGCCTAPPQPRPRRPRLRASHAGRQYKRCGAGAGHGAHRRARALLPGRRPDRARAFRGIGVRIEDDVLVTEEGFETRRPRRPAPQPTSSRGSRACSRKGAAPRA